MLFRSQSVIENMAPVLTRLFTPLFTVLLLAFLVTMAWTRSPILLRRELLIGFDLLLALVVGLVLYALSARDPDAPPDVFDGLQLLLVVSALAVDGVALVAMANRISEFGFTPNRVAALGENILLHYRVEALSATGVKVNTGHDYRGSSRALRFEVKAVATNGVEADRKSTRLNSSH